MRARHYQALIAGAFTALGLWLLTNRLSELHSHWHTNDGVAISDSPLPHVPQYEAEDRLPESHYTEGEEPESDQDRIFMESIKPGIPVPTPTSKTEWTPAWDNNKEALPNWPEQSSTPTDVVSTLPTNRLSHAMVEKYVHSILDFEDDSTFERSACPPAIGPRYEGLRTVAGGSDQVRYFFALDLYQSAQIIPRLMSSIVEAIRFLGPEYCAISIIEGRSEDGTYEILAALKSRIEAMGAHFFLSTSTINPLGGEMSRIEALAELRNEALEPLRAQSSSESESGLAEMYSPDAVVIFVNDIALCPEDILELVLQHVRQEAHMTCAFDWIFNGTLFYDVWVSRSLVGNTFFEIPHDGSWTYSKDLFFDELDGKRRYEAFRPLQVYSCWGGMVTLDAAPFAEDTIRFRASKQGECYMGEPTLLAKDLYGHGLGKILAVPSVNVAYSDQEAVGTKATRGYVGSHVNISMAEMEEEEYVQWQVAPPGMLKCMPNFDQQTWTQSV